MFDLFFVLTVIVLHNSYNYFCFIIGLQHQNGMSRYGATSATKSYDHKKVQSLGTNDYEQFCGNLPIKPDNNISATQNSYDGVSYKKDGEVHFKCEVKNKHLHDCQNGNDKAKTIVLANDKDVVLEQASCVHIIKPSHHEHHHIQADQLQGVRSFLLLVAMSCHKMFEGLAVGLQDSSTAVWNLFLAIIIHECIIAFSLGIQFAENIQHVRRAVLFVIIFALMTPVGAAIGTAMTEGAAGNPGVNAASAILQAVSTGVFLYVTFFEVLGREVGSDHNIVKVLLVLLGYGVIALVQLLNPEPEHGH